MRPQRAAARKNKPQIHSFPMSSSQTTPHTHLYTHTQRDGVATCGKTYLSVDDEAATIIHNERALIEKAARETEDFFFFLNAPETSEREREKKRGCLGGVLLGGGWGGGHQTAATVDGRSCSRSVVSEHRSLFPPPSEWPK